ncbi:uroporphyrinogen-III C-methyltransferase [Oligella ureolytica]
MAKGRNRNNQAANPPENIEESTDAEFLEHEDRS